MNYTSPGFTIPQVLKTCILEAKEINKYFSPMARPDFGPIVIRMSSTDNFFCKDWMKNLMVKNLEVPLPAKQRKFPQLPPGSTPGAQTNSFNVSPPTSFHTEWFFGFITEMGHAWFPSATTTFTAPQCYSVSEYVRAFVHA